MVKVNILSNLLASCHGCINLTVVVYGGTDLSLFLDLVMYQTGEYEHECRDVALRILLNTMKREQIRLKFQMNSENNWSMIESVTAKSTYTVYHLPAGYDVLCSPRNKRFSLMMLAWKPSHKVRQMMEKIAVISWEQNKCFVCQEAILRFPQCVNLDTLETFMRLWNSEMLYQIPTWMCAIVNTHNVICYKNINVFVVGCWEDCWELVFGLTGSFVWSKTLSIMDQLGAESEL